MIKNKDNPTLKSSDEENSYTKSILIVEDDKDMVTAIEIALKEGLEEEFHDIPIYKAFNGDNALEVFNREKPCVIVLDLMMPKRSGHLVMEAIIKKRKLETDKPPQIIVETGIEGKRHQQFAEQLGVRAFFAKPFRMGRLVDVVKEALKQLELD